MKYWEIQPLASYYGMNVVDLDKDSPHVRYPHRKWGLVCRRDGKVIYKNGQPIRLYEFLSREYGVPDHLKPAYSK